MNMGKQESGAVSGSAIEIKLCTGWMYGSRSSDGDSKEEDEDGNTSSGELSSISLPNPGYGWMWPGKQYVCSIERILTMNSGHSRSIIAIIIAEYPRFSVFGHACHNASRIYESISL